MEIESKIRKWGNSYGVMLSKQFLESEHLQEEDIVKVNIVSKKADIGKLQGLWKFKRPIKEIMKDIKEGYD